MQHKDGNDGIKCVKQLYTWEETEEIRIKTLQRYGMAKCRKEKALKILTPHLRSVHLNIYLYIIIYVFNQLSLSCQLKTIET